MVPRITRRSVFTSRTEVSVCGAPIYDPTSVYETGRQCIWLLGSRDQLHVCHLAVGVSLSHAIAEIGTMGGAATTTCTRPHDRRSAVTRVSRTLHPLPGSDIRGRAERENGDCPASPTSRVSGSCGARCRSTLAQCRSSAPHDAPPRTYFVPQCTDRAVC